MPAPGSFLWAIQVSSDGLRLAKSVNTPAQPDVPVASVSPRSLSLNNRIYGHTQVDNDGNSDRRCYNRYFVRYTQPPFKPNGLKNDIEGAELDLEERWRLRLNLELEPVLDLQLKLDELSRRGKIELR